MRKPARQSARDLTLGSTMCVPSFLQTGTKMCVLAEMYIPFLLWAAVKTLGKMYTCAQAHTHTALLLTLASELSWCLHPQPVTHRPSYVRSISTLSSHSALMTAHECIPSSSALSPTATTVTTPFLVSSSTCLMLHAQLFTPLRRSEKQGAPCPEMLRQQRLQKACN